MGCERVLAELAPDVAHAEVAHLHLAPELGAARAARRWVLEQVRVSQERAQVLALLVSELVTNAVVHARTRLVVGVTDLDQGVLVTVEDRDLVEPQQQPYSMTRTSGRGVQLLDALSDRWGVVKDDHGKTVWCLVGRRPS